MGFLTAALVLALSVTPAVAAPDDEPPADVEAALDRLDAVTLQLRPRRAPLEAEVSLGRQLFFDPRLSAEKAMSCATCHNPALAWTDGLPRASGRGGRKLGRNTPTLLNMSDHSLFFRDGRALSLEEQALAPIQDPAEMGSDPKVLEKDLARIPGYRRQFEALYGPGQTRLANAAKALAAFVGTIRSPRDSPFDRFRTDRAALDPAQKRGLLLFTGKARCVRCHEGAGFSNGFFHNIGLKPDPAAEDVGRFAVVPVDYTRRAFKTVPLRDVALTAPYMHDGSLASLSDVVAFYDRGGDEHDGVDLLIAAI